jgi:hypothetical protein
MVERHVRRDIPCPIREGGDGHRLTRDGPGRLLVRPVRHIRPNVFSQMDQAQSQQPWKRTLYRGDGLAVLLPQRFGPAGYRSSVTSP